MINLIQTIRNFNLERDWEQFHIDPLEAAEEKLVKNAEKYPIEKAKGGAA